MGQDEKKEELALTIGTAVMPGLLLDDFHVTSGRLERGSKEPPPHLEGKGLGRGMGKKGCHAILDKPLYALSVVASCAE